MGSDTTTRWMPGWQRGLIVVACMLVTGPARAAGGPIGIVATVVFATIGLAALGFVELAMALWYRSRRALRRRH